MRRAAQFSPLPALSPGHGAAIQAPHARLTDEQAELDENKAVLDEKAQDDSGNAARS